MISEDMKKQIKIFIGIVVVIIIALFLLGKSLISSAKSLKPFSLPESNQTLQFVCDEDYGVEYAISRTGDITPRLRADGLPSKCGDFLMEAPKRANENNTNGEEYE